MKLKIRLRQIPIETLTEGQQVLSMATTLIEGENKSATFGPCLMEVLVNEDWIPVEFVK